MKCVLQIEVEYDDRVNSAEVAEAMDNALSRGYVRVAGITNVGGFYFAAEQECDVAVGAQPIASCPQHRAFKAFILGSALAGSAVNSSDPEPVVIQRASRIAEEAMRELS